MFADVGEGPEREQGQGDAEPAGEVRRRLPLSWRPRRAPATRTDAPSRPRRSTRSLVFRVVAVAAAVITAGSTLAAYVTFRHDWNAIKRVDVRRDLSYHPRPPADPNALNVLLIGSDSRAGANKKFGADVVGQRSDTIMLLHIAPGAHQLIVLSFPRDSVVPILACAPENGSAGQTAQPTGYVEQVNATFAYGGPGCLWETLEQTTGIHIDDFVELTFTGFEHVINDVGGVSVCVPVAIHDPDSLLNLSAGRHHVYGREALAFWRARYIGEGSDLQRINRDQYLMASLLQGLARSGLTHSPVKILKVIQDVVSHGDISTDSQLTPGRLVTIADELHSLPPSAVQFIEIPTVPYPGDPRAWVQWARPQATALFTAIAHDTRLPAAAPAVAARKRGTGLIGASAVEAANAATRAAAAASAPTASPASVSVAVFNGTMRPNLATTTAASLTSRGFHVVGIADAATLDFRRSVVEYASAADLPAARSVAALVSHVRLQRDSRLPSGTIQLILGSSFSGLSTGASVPPAGPSASTGSLASQYGGIRGNVGICSDAGAFAGPDGTS
jgi:LCP family protein required for cell wall assembly